MEKQYLITKDEYQIVKQHWVSTEHHPAWHHIIYNILRSKPSDYGFTKRVGNFQGNDPWYGYNAPLREARQNCSTVNPWEKYKDTPWDEFKNKSNVTLYERHEKIMSQRRKEFKDLFGIDVPVNFMEHLDTLHKIGEL